jgi:Mannose-6-phosphate isomerase
LKAIITVIFGGIALLLPGCQRAARQGRSDAYVLKAGEGEKLGGGSIVVKADPRTGSYDASMFTQTFLPGMATSLHIHERADEFFFVHEGSGTAVIGSKSIQIGKGDVIFIPKGTVHGIENSGSEGALEIVAWVSRPGLEQFFRDVAVAREKAAPRKLTLDEINAIARKYGDKILGR